MSARSLIRSTSLLVLGSVALLGIGCSRTTPSATTSTSSDRSGSMEAGGRDAGRSPTFTGAAPLVRGGACDHPYYPLRAGYEVRYHTTFPPIGAPGVATVSSGGYGLRVSTADATSATLVATFDSSTPGEAPITSVQVMDCASGGLRARSYIDFGSRVTGGAAANKFRVTTRSSSGEMLPADMRVGSEWRGAFGIRMEAVTPGPDSPLQSPLDVDVSITRRALLEEMVRVPAGEYRALKVAATTDLGMGAPITGTEWWAEGVGMIKSVYSFGTPGSGDFVTEATSVTVPR